MTTATQERLSALPKREGLCCYLVMVALSAVTLLVTSLDSPLTRSLLPYTDIQMYMDVAREMLDGKVMYAEVYDHKGPWHYFAYIPAILIDRWGSRGVYLLEVTALAAYLVITCRFCLRKKVHPVAAAIAAASTAVAISCCIGAVPGQSEYLALPWLAFAVCAYIECVEKRRPLTRAEAIVIGLGCGWCLWAKFTICLLYAMLAIALAAHYLKTLCGPSLMARHVTMVLLGILVATVPVLAYFAAVGDLSLPFSGYFEANLLGGYLQAEQQDNGLVLFSVLTTMLPYSALCLLLGFISACRREGPVSRPAGAVCTLMAAAYLLYFLFLGRAASQYLMVEFAFMPLWAVSFAAWLDNGIKRKSVVKCVVSVLLMPVMLFIVVDLEPMVGNGVFGVSERQQVGEAVAEDVELGSTLFLYRLWDQGYFMSSHATSAASTIGCYKLQCALDRQDVELASILRDRSADYILANEAKLAAVGLDPAEAGYEAVARYTEEDTTLLLSDGEGGAAVLYKRG